MIPMKTQLMELQNLLNSRPDDEKLERKYFQSEEEIAEYKEQDPIC